MAEKKEKKYVSDNAQLMAEWDWDKNTDTDPKKLTCGSHKKVWWIGTCGHTWESQVKSRSFGRGCPVCAGKVVLSGFNDIQTTDPHILEEWDYEKNFSILPSGIMRNSHTEIWWICKNGHSWKASPNHRISKGRNCPFCCHNPRVLKGQNDLASVYPKIASEWHPTRNGMLLPSQVSANSSKRVWWQCSKGHEWKTAVNHRANGSNCPYCNNSLQTSFPEQAVYYYVKRAYPDAINGFTDLFKNHGMELDIYVPSLKIGIEYDGGSFHKTIKQQQREIKKYHTCQENSIFLIRIRENLLSNPNEICDKVVLLTKNLTNAIGELKQILPKLGDIDVERDRVEILSKYYSELEAKSLSCLYPSVSKEWNYSRNGELKPTMFSAHSNVKVWWICSEGHEWKASIDGRVSGRRCPFCSNRLVLPGFNDLAFKRPDLVEEWDYSKNIISPNSVLPGSGKKVWWICSNCKNEWIAEISSRNKGHGCPECAKEKRKSK